MARGAHIEIESGIPVPTRHHRTIYPFGEMQIGDSFFVPGARTSQLTNCFGSYVRTHPGLKFAARKVDGGVRVWRVA